MAELQHVGIIGLGNMGTPMAANLAAAGFPLVVYDKAGAGGRAPEGALVATSPAHVATLADPIILSLPDARAVRSVVEEIVAHPGAETHTIVDTSTIGVGAARKLHQTLLDAGFEYIDAPVSGGVAGARAATISIMFAGSRAALERLSPILSALGRHLLHVGTRPGQGQAMKLLNNFLSACSMAATCEAVAFGVTQGLDPKTMIEVLNVSSGVSSATLDKFPNRVLTGTFDAGFSTRLMRKDVGLYLENASEAGVQTEIAECVRTLWERFGESAPESDFTELYRFVESAGESGTGES